MLSIVIASAKPDLLDQASNNIKQTIGIPHEILAYQNADGQKGLCEIYNLGAKEAQYECLCFMHEDILFETQDWGMKVIETLRTTDNIGLLGVAGSTYKSLTPSSWFPPHEFGRETWRMNIKQVDQTGDETHDYYNPRNEKISRVACVDGVWLCSKKEIIEKHRFDEKLLRNFHGYDIDLSMEIGECYGVYVTFEILLKHFSAGNFNDSWLNETLKVHSKWIGKLPVNSDPSFNFFPIEKAALRNFLLAAIPSSHVPVRLIMKFLNQLLFKRKIGLKMYKKTITRIMKIRFRR